MLELIEFYQRLVSQPGVPHTVFTVVVLVLLGAALVRTAWEDILESEIPANPVYAALILGLFVAAMKPASHPGLDASLVGGALAALLFMWARLVMVWMRGAQGLGFGEVKLAGVAGIWLGWEDVGIFMLASAVLGLLVYTLVARIRQARGRQKSSCFAFTPAMGIALVVLFCAQNFAFRSSAMAWASLP